MVMPRLEVVGGLVAESGVEAPRGVPPLDEVEDREAGLVASPEGVAVDELAFQPRDEALAEGAVVGIRPESCGKAGRAFRMRCFCVLLTFSPDDVDSGNELYS